ncbi:hypothetical protein PRZ48_005140 [Zasmidium cellare]|uniref:Uncharacterized protein n=1 Tax=Zasmidium cellare TaxID=395010 RepID=A0ABR0ES60_ZASCE|nr:hypothetical protein PRZ48_005140 [Zasmidium cellare]
MPSRPRITRHQTPYPLIAPENFISQLKGKTVLVTGAGHGIGKAIAHAFASSGANVACVSRTWSEVQATADFIRREYGVNSLPLAADVTCDESVQHVVDEVTERLGAIHVLVNNAAIDWMSPFEIESSLDKWWRVMETNLKGPVDMIRAVLPQMLARQDGVIISICSRNATFNMPCMTAYSTSKTALLRFHQCLDLEVRDRGVRTYIVQPGDVSTTLSKVPGTVNEDAVKDWPYMQKILDIIENRPSDAPELAAGTCVALASGGKFERLSGLYVDAQEDIREVLLHLEHHPEDRQRLYTLKVDTLS